MQNIDGNTMNLITENIEGLKQLFPEAFSEGKVDFEKLKLLLGENIDSSKEKYSFNWKGKNDAIKIALAQNTGTLRPDKETSKNCDKTSNLYLEGDNLEVLRVMQDSYRGKVKMIYIDPPYNTGKEFVYKDDFKDNIMSYLEMMDENMKSNPETNGRYHTDWLNMMYPRLKLARNLLKEDGVIFMSIDDNEVTNLRRLGDEIFGEDNFISQIVWQKKYAASNDNKYISDIHEYIICYAKNKELFKPNLFDRPEELNSKYKNPDNDPRGDWVSTNLSVKTFSKNNYYEIEGPTGEKFLPPPSRCWVVSKEKYQELLNDNRIWFGKDGTSRPYKKTFMSEVQQGIVPTSLWLHQDAGHNIQAKGEIRNLFSDTTGLFDTPKPTKLIKRLISLACHEEDLILDFFAGSSTTADAVMSLNIEKNKNHKFIMVQIPEKINDKSEAYKAGYTNVAIIGKERIRRAGDKILEDNKDKPGIGSLDTGFKVFKLDTTNLKKWETTLEGVNEEDLTKELQTRLQDMTNPVKEDREQIDMVYEIMLKNGMDLSLSVEEINLSGKKVYSVASSYLIACLEKDISLETIKEIGKQSPKVVVFYDDSFKDDVVKVNAVEHLEKQDIQVRVI